MTCYRRFGVSRLVTVGGRQVDGEATVIAEAFEVAALPFLLGKLAICTDSQICETGCGCI